MESKKYNLVSKKIAKWVKGKSHYDFESSFVPARNILEEYLQNDWNLEGASAINKIVKIHSAIGYYGYWNYCNFLELYSEKSNINEIWKWWIEGAKCRILQYSLGYAFPQNIAPIDDGKIALSICDSIIFDDDLGKNIIEGYFVSKNKKRPLRNPQSVIQYSYNIYNKYCGINHFDFSKISPKKMLDTYWNLFTNIESSNNLFKISFEHACDFHLERSKNSMLYEFSWEEDMLIPSELLATLYIRQKMGLSYDNIHHPLINPFFSFFKKDSEKISINPFIEDVKQKIKKEFLDNIILI